ncbi:hypothetical protein NW767_014568 [Fusarium falciforme]|nr:hypothetical protein NW767_014568 [Fusarium falciforme]
MTETLSLKRMACVACTKAKRRCSKQTPACRRCIEKKAVCRYPARRRTLPYHLVFSQDGAVTTIPTHERDQEALQDRISGFDGQRLQGNTVATQRPTNTSYAHLLKSPWFLCPPSWEIDHSDDLTSQINFSDAALTYYIDKLQSWLKQWTAEGCCPFIHSSLYQAHLPDCIQDVFTTLAAYQSRTPATEKMVLRIVEQRANRLVEGHTPMPDELGVIMLDPAAHLARTQALLIYKIIRLFDGDIRARAQAEAHIDILSQWARQLWQSAQLAVSLGQTKGAPDQDADGLVRLQLRAGENLASIWRAWGFAESIRRTYLTATLTEAVFQTLKQGWAPCPGGITFTASKGMWDAPHPQAWLDEFPLGGVITIQCIEGYRLFGEALPSDVDEFTHATLIVSYGLERFEEWSTKREG